MVCVKNSTVSFKCALSDQEYKISVEFDDRNRSTTRFTQKCDFDESGPAFYQACGIVDNVNLSNVSIACGWHICEQGPIFEAKNRRCDERDSQFADLICDGKCDGGTCEDESDCEGMLYGLRSCTQKDTGKTVYIPVGKLCDDTADCTNDEDENICNVTNHDTLQSCHHYKTNKTVPIHNFTRCSIFDTEKGITPYCEDFLDQTNCSNINRIGGYCEVNGYVSSVSRNMVCVGRKLITSICDDDSENYCMTTSSDCRIHKHKFCDGVRDCEDNSDEKHDDCEFMTEDQKCIRKFGIPGRNETIPLKWILDKKIDCLDNHDEDNAEWKQCRVGPHSYIVQKNEKCKNAFICPEPDQTVDFVNFDLLCDSKESCKGKENEVCKVSRDIPTIQKLAPVIEGDIKDLCNTSACEIKEFNYRKYEIFGEQKIRLRVPTKKVDCSDKFGEHYVFLSCLGLCENSYCPLKDEILKHDSCSKDVNDRIITLATPIRTTPTPNPHLTFVTKSRDRFHNDYFQCDNGRCLNYSQVCDLVNDCGDMSDELNCTNHFICEEGKCVEGDCEKGKKRKDKMRLISINQKCDNFYDCLDLSDECNTECTRNIIQNGSSLSPFCWVIGIFSVILNLATLVILPGALTKCRNENVFFSKILVMLISVGDFLMGIYLVMLSVYDNIVYKKTFCQNQGGWYTGSECKALGIISTVGSQLSLFSMTTLSMFRLCKVLMNGLPLPISRRTIMKCTGCTLLVTVLSVAIAVIPLLPFQVLEDYFVQGIYYDPNYKVFVGLNSKQKHVSILKEFYADSKNLTTDTSWEDIGNLVDGMFSTDHGKIPRKNVHFYGNDGLCMFKYIVRSDDARGGRDESRLQLRADPVVWAILIINLVCFVLILISAIVITYKTRRSSSQAGQKKNKAARKRNRSLELRILAIVVTDFLCWVPFIIICFLHNKGHLDSTKWYQALALVVLPLNSLINPLIYDRTITQFCKKRVNTFTASLGSGNAKENGPASPKSGGPGMQMRAQSN